MLTRTGCSCRIHGPMFNQQYLCMCKHAAWRCSSDFSHVGLASSEGNFHAKRTSTGMHVVAATFLLPVGVTVYTFVGGIKAT